MLAYTVALAATVPICANVVPLVEHSILNPASLLELSAQDRLIWLEDAAVAFKLAGAAGVGVGLGVGVGGGGLTVEPAT